MEWTLAAYVVTGLIPVSSLIAIAFALLLWRKVAQIQLTGGQTSVRSGNGREFLLEEEQRGEEEVVAKAAEIQAAIADGAISFLNTEYKYMGVFMVIMSVVIFSFLSIVSPEGTRTRRDELQMGIFSTAAFILGALTSCLSGYLGMMIATFANARTAVEARKGIAPAFMCAFRSGAVMGFLLTGFALLNLFLAILVFMQFFGDDWKGLFEAITGYGLGGSSIALFGRVAGGIYTKAADVGADLVGKIEKDIPEDDPRNPAVIADNVGDNVGDIAGMGADLFGSFAESTCAALIISSLSSYGLGLDFVAMMFPLVISACGILVCLLTTLLATDIWPAKAVNEIEHTLKMQLIISTLIMTPVALGCALLCLPTSFTMPIPSHNADVPFETKTVLNWHMFVCIAAGLWGGLLIGLQTEYFTSNRYQPVQDVADACKTGAATNIIFGLALGYKSCIIPVFVLALTIYVGNSLAGMFGIACCALGMLSTLSTCLAIDAYGPIADNAGGIAEMAGMGDDIRERTDALDAAGNTTAAIGKGFAIGSAALVSLALFGAYVTRSKIDLMQASILDPKVFAGLMVGAMLPYWFSAMTMKSVGKAALAMVEEVRRQFATIAGIMEGTTRPDYKRCVEISTTAAIAEMMAPGALVMLTPLITGSLFGTQALAGLLAGALVSGVQLAISMSNTGGGWDNAKKYVEAGATEHARSLGGKGSDVHKAAVIGDTVGDPLKDTSGPSLNILIKLMAVESLVFAPFFLNCYGGQGLIFQFFGN
jgi:H(+)-translocating pyrophosphatase